ncbi:hypothetical protein GCM10008997_09600 [Halomonas salifodinae]
MLGQAVGEFVEGERLLGQQGPDGVTAGVEAMNGAAGAVNQEELVTQRMGAGVGRGTPASMPLESDAMAWRHSRRLGHRSGLARLTGPKHAGQLVDRRQRLGIAQQQAGQSLHQRQQSGHQGLVGKLIGEILGQQLGQPLPRGEPNHLGGGESGVPLQQDDGA